MMESKIPNVHIDTIPFCNAKCIFCGYPNMQREKKKMPLKLFRKIIKEMGAWDGKFDITPHHYGEFFLHPEWFSLLQYINDNIPNAHITIATNGSCLDDKALDKLLSIQNLSSITFSVYAYSPKTYKKITGLPESNLKRLEHASDRFSQERKDIEQVIGHTPFFLTKDEFRIFKEHWGKKIRTGTHIITFNHNNSNNTDLHCDSICPDLFKTLIVLNNGDTCGCCFDTEGETFFGNAYNSSLLNIWHGEKANYFRNLHLQNKRNEIPICKSCSRPCDTNSLRKGNTVQNATYCHRLIKRQRNDI